MWKLRRGVFPWGYQLLNWTTSSMCNMELSATDNWSQIGSNRTKVWLPLLLSLHSFKQVHIMQVKINNVTIGVTKHTNANTELLTWNFTMQNKILPALPLTHAKKWRVRCQVQQRWNEPFDPKWIEGLMLRQIADHEDDPVVSILSVPYCSVRMTSIAVRATRTLCCTASCLLAKA